MHTDCFICSSVCSGWSLTATSSRPTDDSDGRATTPPLETTLTSSSSSNPPTQPHEIITNKHISGIRQDLLQRAEKILGMLSQQLSLQWSKGQTGVELLEVRVEILLALAHVAITLLHSKSAYQLSLQALRLLQFIEKDDGEEGKALLRACDVRLWLESRCWMVRSMVGLLMKPGGVEVLGMGGGGEGEEEVGGGVGVVKEMCDECVEVGEVDLMAEVEFHVAQHAMSLLPCQLQAAMQHSQVRVVTTIILCSDVHYIFGSEYHWICYIRK